MKIKIKNVILILIGSGILAFGIYHIHSVSGVTEGGVLGAILLIEHHFGISPAASGIILNLLCYFLGFKVLGKEFIVYSVISSVGFSCVYAVCEMFPRIYPSLGQYPLVASVLGGIFVGIGCGISVRFGGATGGDDAVAMSVSKLTKLDIQWVYLFTDLSVLLLSLTYIPWQRIGYSVITVVISGQLVGFIQKVNFRKT